jgi:hypothetical protein
VALMVASTHSIQGTALWIVFAREGVDVTNDLAMTGEEAGRLACMMLAGIGELRAGDAFRVIAAGNTVTGFPNPPRRKP